MFQKCSIYAITLKKSWGEQSKTETVLYKDIKCKLYQARQALPNTNLAQETNQISFKIVLEPKYTKVSAGMVAYIKDARGMDIGKYLIEGVFYNQNIRGEADYTSLSVSKL